MQKAMDTIGYRQLREEQKAKQEAFKRGETREIMGIGISFFTEIVGAGPPRTATSSVSPCSTAPRSVSTRPAR
jgi:CO/xanthine dehydrogenase Mo-binding subunit